jgi:hypothetical protein
MLQKEIANVAPHRLSARAVADCSSSLTGAVGGCKRFFNTVVVMNTG